MNLDELFTELTVKWQCRACGAERRTLLMPRESKLEAEKRCMDDHIKQGCSAYHHKPATVGNAQNRG